jgi:hypothetical protein
VSADSGIRPRCFSFAVGPERLHSLLGAMNASSEDSEDLGAMAIVNRHYRRHGLRRLLVTLALDAGYLLLLWNLTLQGIGEWRLLVLLPIALSLPFVPINCVEIICGARSLFLPPTCAQLARRQSDVLGGLAALLTLCVATVAVSTLLIRTAR